ncbi:MAG: tetratricopeptide repeat protein [Phycisphaerae bacterium]|nr:tetratricopeptide repeat protein [Phycisphaerae bacterium]
MSAQSGSPLRTPAKKKKYLPAVGPRLKLLLTGIFALVALIGVNSVYLGSVTLVEWATGVTYQDYFYQFMFLGHLILGFLIVLPVVIFGIAHIYNAHNRPNRRAVRAGYALFAVTLLLLGSGIVLTRIENLIDVRNPTIRSTAYWLHVISPLIVVWLFILHRLAGRKIKWKVGISWAGVAGGFAMVMLFLHAQDPRKWNEVGPKTGTEYFLPALSRTATGKFIPKEAMTNDQYCLQCHADIHKTWTASVHRLSSFNNPAYLFSVLNTRKAMFARDGNVKGSRFCATCHDPVPFFSGEFDKPHFDDPNYDLANDPSAQAGITCTVCHAITNINSPRGNGDYTIEEPLHYPFAFSDNSVLQWVNRQLVRAKPEFHKKTFLKPLHKSPEFCGSCHKVHLPPELNAYKWLRGQNHYDAYHLSGVSGHGIVSFYYPPKAVDNCNECHMPTMASADFGAKDFDRDGVMKVHDHQFPSANTAIPYLTGMEPWVNEKHRKFNEGVMRVDIFGVKEGGTIDGELYAPLRPQVPTLKRGQSYLIETIIRTVKMGHIFTQGTADSNEVWLDITVKSGDVVIGRSGGMAADGEVDPWSHFVNAFVIDRNGYRIDRRNAEDIFLPLYSHQIPPGAADVVHYLLKVPEDVSAPVAVDVKLQYRKFDTLYTKQFQGRKFVRNDLPILTLAADTMIFPVEGVMTQIENPPSKIEPWQRWNDYGIALFRKGEVGSNKGELRQAESAFAQVGMLGRPDGALNRARVYIKEGRLDDAVVALREAAAHQPPAPPWSVEWFTGLVNKQNGHLDDAIANFRNVVEMKDTEECRKRGFDFSQDYTVLNEYAQTLFERGLQERGPARREAKLAFLNEARSLFQKSLTFDPENMTAHYNLGLIYADLGDAEKARHHRAEHARYKTDDNAMDRAIAAARIRYPAANHAAEAIVLYDLQRVGAYELPAAWPEGDVVGAAIHREDRRSPDEASRVKNGTNGVQPETKGADRDSR